MTSAVSSSGAWTVLLAAAAVGAFAFGAAVLDSVLDPATVGRGAGERLGRPVWEAARLLRQRRRRVVAADGLLRTVGVGAPLVIALLMSIVVPLGARSVSDLSVGVVWFNAMDVLLWASWWLLGWGSNSAFALVGGYRFLAQALAYELPLMFAMTAPAAAASSVRVGDVVAAQHGQWFVVQMPVAAAVFAGSVVAFSAWGPFDYPLGADAVGGVAAELSGVDRLVLGAGRYALLAVGAAMTAVLFLGGSDGPVLPGWAWSLVKTSAVLVVFVAVRRRLATLRADRIMRVAWLIVLPLTLAQVLVTAVIAVAKG